MNVRGHQESVRRTLIMTLAGVALVVAQGATAGETWRVGFRAGLNRSRVESSERLDGHSTRTGLSGGLVVERHLAGPISIESGMVVVGRSAAREGAVNLTVGDPPDGTMPVRMRIEEHLTYLEVPLLLKATFGSGPLRPWLAAGPTAQFHLSSRSELVALEPGPSFPAGSFGSENTDDDFRDVVAGFEAAAGIHYRLGGGTILDLSAHWAPGLSDLARSNRPYARPTVRSDDLRVFAGVSFAL